MHVFKIIDFKQLFGNRLKTLPLHYHSRITFIRVLMMMMMVTFLRNKYAQRSPLGPCIMRKCFGLHQENWRTAQVTHLFLQPVVYVRVALLMLYCQYQIFWEPVMSNRWLLLLLTSLSKKHIWNTWKLDSLRQRVTMILLLVLRSKR